MLAVDSNAQHVEWGNSQNNRGGLDFLVEIMRHRLTLHNDRSITFIGRGTSTAIDLTLSDGKLKDKIQNWKVDRDLTFLSDHLPITFSITRMIDCFYT